MAACLRCTIALLLGTAATDTAGVMAIDVLAHGAMHNSARHHYMMQNGIPARYEGFVIPLARSRANLSEGKVLYNDNCASCHGSNGSGRTDAAKELDPPPASLTELFAPQMSGMGPSGEEGHFMRGMMHHHPGMSHTQVMGGLNMDAYAFWAISDGGEKLESSMPAFKDVL